MGKVVFLSANTAGDALGGAGRARKRVLEQLGHEFIEVNLNLPGALQLMQSLLSDSAVDFVFTFVGLLSDLSLKSADGTSISAWANFGIPYISLQGDSPVYFFDRHLGPGDIGAHIYAYPEHLTLRKRLPKAPSLMGVAPLHSCNPVPLAEMDFAAKKQGKVLFLKNGNDPKKLIEVWRKAFSGQIFNWLMELADYLASNVAGKIGNDIDGVVIQYLQGKGLDIEGAVNLRLLFVAQLDDYLRRVKSTMMVEALLDFPIEVHGFHWEHVDFQGRRATLVPVADFTTSEALIKGSLAQLDMSPNTELLPHERTARALDAYTVCLTNEQQFFRDNFSQHADFSFRFEVESLQSKVADVLANPGRYVELGVELGTEFQQRYPAENWGKYMQEVAALILANNATGMPGHQDFFSWPPKLL